MLAHQEESALPDPALQTFGTNIWIADGATVSVGGFRYPTRMAVIRLPDGSLFVWSPTAFSQTLRTEVEALGTVRFIVAPNSLHHLYLTDWQRAFPSGKLYAAPGLRARRKDIAFDGDIAEAPNPEWAEHIDQVPMTGNVITTEIVFFHRDSGTVLFTDLVQNFPPDWFTGWRAMVARLDRMIGHEPQVPQKFRVAFVDRRSARAALKRILAWPAQNVLMAHGTPVRENASIFIADAFQWLSRR
jgi:hypothetical protein